ncbi:hypothetical protein KR009_006535 [Drosophila setifemur]|nr:hypothetical protein KR009_006535 [Drosophila setifemur]
MTILGKLRGEPKDQEKVPLPMNLNDEALMHHGSLIAPKGSTAYSDTEADTESMVFNRPQHHCLKSFLLFLIALVVMLMGVLGGWTLYRLYAPSHASMRYHALCEIPYPEDSMELPRVYQHSEEPYALNWRALLPQFGPVQNFPDGSASLTDDSAFFREDIELDGESDDDGYARVDVPDFKDGRRGRFMHDFKENQSAIIDTTTGRCFIMPLDRDTTLPPTGFMDLMKKMSTGYYNIDTERVRRQMRVVTPRITDLSLISERIANECYDMKVYLMEKFISGGKSKLRARKLDFTNSHFNPYLVAVSKRSADPLPESAKYAQFMGKGVIEYDLANIAEVEAFEAEEAKLQHQA